MRPGRVLPKAAWREQSAAAGSREQPRPLLAPLVETGRVLPEGGWREQRGAAEVAKNGKGARRQGCQTAVAQRPGCQTARLPNGKVAKR